MNEENSDHQEMDIQVTAKKDELSLKAKGAGLMILIAICLVGIILLAALPMVGENTNFFIIGLAITILSYITYSLIATLDAVLGLTVRHRHHD